MQLLTVSVLGSISRLSESVSPGRPPSANV
jgi:hypothetical protein